MGCVPGCRVSRCRHVAPVVVPVVAVPSVAVAVPVSVAAVPASVAAAAVGVPAPVVVPVVAVPSVVVPSVSVPGGGSVPCRRAGGGRWWWVPVVAVAGGGTAGTRDSGTSASGAGCQWPAWSQDWDDEHQVSDKTQWPHARTAGHRRRKARPHPPPQRLAPHPPGLSYPF